MQPVFTRYLYEKLHVKYSLAWAMLEMCQEESLFWAYELYWSGFADEVWYWINEIYEKYYKNLNPRFKRCLSKYFEEWKTTGDHGLLGTVVGTLAMRSRLPGQPERMIILRYSDKRHETIAPVYPPRKYLGTVSQWPIREEAKYGAQKDGLLLSSVQNAYLGDWLYYSSPIWLERIKEFRGVVGEEGVAFETDEDLEAFHELWGLEPDEQSMEMHLLHGIYLEEEEGGKNAVLEEGGVR